MEYELKGKKWFFVGLIIVMTGMFIYFMVTLFGALSYNPMAELGLPGPVMQESIFDYPQYLLSLIVIFALTVVVDFTCIKTLRQKLTFNNVTFTVNGVTYRYTDIEKVYFGVKGIPIWHHTRNPVFRIIVDGKSVYNYNQMYDGFKEFHFYLNYYKIPVTPI